MTERLTEAELGTLEVGMRLTQLELRLIPELRELRARVELAELANRQRARETEKARAENIDQVNGMGEFRRELRNALFPFWPNNMGVSGDEIVNAVHRVVAENTKRRAALEVIKLSNSPDQPHAAEVACPVCYRVASAALATPTDTHQPIHDYRDPGYRYAYTKPDAGAQIPRDVLGGGA